MITSVILVLVVRTLGEALFNSFGHEVRTLDEGAKLLAVHAVTFDDVLTVVDAGC